MMNFMPFEYLVACAMYTYKTQCITMRDLNEYRIKLEDEFKKRNIEAMFRFSNKYAEECVHDNPDVFELICDGTAVRRKDEVSIGDLIGKYMSYMSNDDLLAVTAVKNALDERVVVTLDDGKVNRNGRVYSDELLAKYNESCPREIRCGDKVVGHMEHVSHDGERYVAAMTIDKGMTEEVKNLAMGIRAVGEIDENGECHEMNIESIDFVKGSNMTSPEEEKLLKYYEANKNDLDGGFLNSMVSLAIDCFNEMKALGDKAKVRDIHKYLVAVHHVTSERMEEGFSKHLAALERLNKEP